MCVCVCVCVTLVNSKVMLSKCVSSVCQLVIWFSRLFSELLEGCGSLRSQMQTGCKRPSANK